MKKKYVVPCLLLSVIMLAPFAIAKEKSSVELGKKLFNDPTIGGSTNESSCNSCHAAGKGLEKAGQNPKLSKAINKCITGPMKGTKVDGRSVQIRSLKMYIESLGG